MPSFSQQLISETSQVNQSNLRSATEQAVTQIIEQRLPQAIESATANINLNQQMETWLAEQEMGVQQRVAKEVQSNATVIVDESIARSLAVMVAPLVKEQVEQALQKQGESVDELLQVFEERIAKLDRVVMGLGVVIIILAVLNFI
jgi:hypothetical protein